MQLRRVAPIIRIFDEAKARSFYVDYLGMTVDWEHRFEPGLPLYLAVSRGDVVLHLSEHHGDGTPGTHVLVYVDGVADLHAELAGRAGTAGVSPGLDVDEIGSWISVPDPFGNVIRFLEPAPPRT